VIEKYRKKKWDRKKLNYAIEKYRKKKLDTSDVRK